MIHRSSFSTRTKAITGGLCLLAFVGAFAQAQLAEVASPIVHRAQPVSLVSGTCPAVHQGDALFLDWNPGFAPSFAVNGLKSFRLIFLHLGEDGVNLNPASRLVLDSGPGKITAIGNGYFHIEARLPSSAHLGTYHLVATHSSPELPPDYQGEVPRMTLSPERESFCVVVISASRPPSSSPPD